MQLVPLKHLLLLFCFGIFFFSGYAQKEITTTEVLLGAQNIEQIQFDSIQLAFLKDYNHNLPLINNVEFRSETRDFLLRRQEYAIRIKPNSLRAKLAKKKVSTSKINEAEIQGRIHLNDELEDRYNLLVDYVFNERLAAAYIERKIQLQDKLNILEQTIYDENFDVRDVVDTEESLFDTEVALLNLQEVKSYQNEILKLMVGENITTLVLNSTDLISPKQIITASLDVIASNPNLEIQLRQSKLETIDNEMILDVAKSKKIIDFVQAKYGGKNNDFFDENVAIGIGINLPFFGNTREKKSDHYFNKLRTESEIISLQKEQEKKEQIAFEEFRRTASIYQIFQDQAANSSVSSLLNTYKKIEGVSPLILLKLKISEHNKQIEILKIEHELYEKYIKMLVSKNALFQSPFKNYLITNNSLIEK
jgi:hypothetical protein